MIKASSGLSDAEVEKMMKDAEENKEQDKKFHELVVARNQADGLIHATEKALKDLGSKVSADDKKKTESVISELKALLKGENKDAIEAKTTELGELSSKISEQAQQQGAASGAANGAGAQQEAKKDDGVVDAEFEEVKKDQKKDQTDQQEK